MSVKTKMTAGDHKANRLQKQLDGHRRLIGDLQEALRMERNRADNAESSAKAGWMGFELASSIARQLLDEAHPGGGAKWTAWRERWPGILKNPSERVTTKEETA